MPELPPRAEVIDALRYVVAPALAISAVVCGLLVVPRLRRSGPVLGLFALAGSLVAVNHFRGVFPWWPDVTWWRAAGLVVAGVFLAEFIAQYLHTELAYLLRGLAAGLSAATVTPPAWQDESRLVVPAIGLLLAATWGTQLWLASRDPGGVRPLVLSLVCFGAAGVLLHHGSLGLADLLNALGVGLLVLAAASRFADMSSVVVTIVPVVMFLLIGRALADSAVPTVAFVLVGLTAPLTRLPPRAGRFSHWPTVVAVGVQVVIAVGLAMWYAPLKFGDDW